MKTFLTVSHRLLCLLLLLGAGSHAGAATPALLDDAEAQYDQVMTDYLKKLKAVRAEKDDRKAIAIIRQMKTEFEPRITKLAPQLEAWVKSMSETQRAALKKRMETKPWVKEMIEVGFDPAFFQRIEKNPEMKKAMNELNTAFKKLDSKEIDPDAEKEEEGSDDEEDKG